MEIKHVTCNKRTSDLATVSIHCVERGREILSSAGHDHYGFFKANSRGSTSQFDWPYLH